MTPSPNPQELDSNLGINTVADYKRTDCRRYLKCLDIAEAAKWNQFHCNDCQAYEKLPDDHPSNHSFNKYIEKLRPHGEED